MPIANLGSEGLLRKGVLSPVLACNKGSVQEVCIVRIANSGNSYVGVILYIYWGGVTGMFFINSNTGNSYIIRKVNGSITSEIEFKRKDGSLFVRSKANTASFRVSALFLDSSFVDLSSSMNIGFPVPSGPERHLLHEHEDLPVQTNKTETHGSSHPRLQPDRNQYNG